MSAIDVVATLLLLLFAGMAWRTQDGGDMFTLFKQDVQQKGGSRPRRTS